MPDKTIYQQKVDTRSKKAMLDFLQHHYRYYTMNSWNRLDSFAHIVKLHTLQMPEMPQEQVDVAWALIEGIDCPDYEQAVHDLINEFTQETGYTAYFNGRSSGYIVMRSTPHPITNRCEPTPDSSDFNDMSMDELREWVKLVQRFDKLCDDIRHAFIYAATHYKIKESTILVKQTVTQIVDPEQEGED